MKIKIIHKIVSIGLALCVIASGGIAITQHHCTINECNSVSAFNLASDCSHDSCHNSHTAVNSCCSENIDYQSCCKIEFAYYESDSKFILQQDKIKLIAPEINTNLFEHVNIYTEKDITAFHVPKKQFYNPPKRAEFCSLIL